MLMELDVESLFEELQFDIIGDSTRRNYKGDSRTRSSICAVL